MTQKEIIILLLQDHLSQTHLIKGLESLGLYSEKHYLHLTEIIFELIGIEKENDELFEVYLEWCTQIKEKDIFGKPELLKEYAEGIYDALISEAKTIKNG